MGPARRSGQEPSWSVLTIRDLLTETGFGPALLAANAAVTRQSRASTSRAELLGTTVLLFNGQGELVVEAQTLAPLCRITEQEMGAITVGIGVSAPGRDPVATFGAFRWATGDAEP